MTRVDFVDIPFLATRAEGEVMLDAAAALPPGRSRDHAAARARAALDAFDAAATPLTPGEQAGWRDLIAASRTPPKNAP